MPKDADQLAALDAEIDALAAWNDNGTLKVSRG